MPSDNGTDAVAEDLRAIVEQLRSIEETLRDLAYDALRERAEGGGDKAVERRYEQARRAVEKAARVLSGTARGDDGSE
jgi:hypothetical protein